MSKFHQGPADGVSLNLSRSPLYLRVVVDRAGEIDALDQPDDAPRPGEVVYVYRRGGDPTVGFVDYRDKQGRRAGHRLSSADYRWVEDAPSQDVLTDLRRWQEWALARRASHPGEAR